MAGKTRASEAREAVTRKATKRPMPKPHWQSKLYIPPHVIPAGMTYKWVRVATINQADGNNWQNNMISGWKPVDRSRHIDLFPFIPIPGLSQEEKYINVGGLILCEKPSHEVADDKAARERDTMEQIQSINWTLDGPNAAPIVNESEPVRIERVQAEFQE